MQLNEVKRKRTLTFDYYYVNLLLLLFYDWIKVCLLGRRRGNESVLERQLGTRVLEYLERDFIDFVFIGNSERSLH